MSNDLTKREIYRSPGFLARALRIDRGKLLFIAFIVFTFLLAVVIPFIEFKFQMVLVLIPVTLLVIISILRNPYLGICLFFLFDYGRLDFFFPPLRPLRVAIILEVVTLLSWIFHLIKTRKHVNWLSFNWMFLGFLGVITSTVITAKFHQLAYNIFESMAIYFMIYFIATNVVDSFSRLNKLIWMLFLIHFFFSVKGILAGGRGGGAFMGDENDFALAMNMMIPFAFFMFMGARNRLKKIGILVILVTMTLAVISSMSRGGWVGLMVTVVLCIIKSKRIFVSLIIAAILAVAIVSFAPQKYWDEVKTITDTKEATAASRINYWKAGVRMFLAYPLTGVGANNGGVNMPMYYKGERDAATQWGRAFHGTLPQIIGELGGLGMLFYLLMLFTALKYLNRLSRKGRGDPYNKIAIYANALMVSIISYLTTATFLSTAYYPHLWTLYTLSMILVILSGTDYHKTETGVPEPKSILGLSGNMGQGNA
jgi:probable O-glycosylation ligase (exosortase A-associated)